MRTGVQGEKVPPRKPRRKRATAGDSWTDLDLLTVGEVSEICRVHPKTVRNWVRDKLLKAVRRGRLFRIPAKALQEFLQNNEY